MMKPIVYDNGEHKIPSEGDIVDSTNLISADNNNKLVVGSDGGLYVHNSTPHDRGTINITPTTADPVTRVYVGKAIPAPSGMLDMVFTKGGQALFDVANLQEKLRDEISTATFHLIMRKAQFVDNAEFSCTSNMYVNGKKYSVGDVCTQPLESNMTMATMLITKESVFIFF